MHALQFLDVINMKDPGQKSQFYRCTLKEVLPLIPKVSNAQVISVKHREPVLVLTVLIDFRFGRIDLK